MQTHQSIFCLHTQNMASSTASAGAIDGSEIFASLWYKYQNLRCCERFKNYNNWDQQLSFGAKPHLKSLITYLCKKYISYYKNLAIWLDESFAYAYI